MISAAGGVGSLAVQLARPLGAGRVLATASSEDKRALCLELGADVALDGDADGLRERILAATDGRGVDVVLEMAGCPVFDAALRALADMGRLVVYGISSREQNEVRTGRLFKRSQSVIGFWLFHYLERREHLAGPLAELFDLAARGELRAVVGDTYGVQRGAPRAGGPRRAPHARQAAAGSVALALGGAEHVDQRGAQRREALGADDLRPGGLGSADVSCARRCSAWPCSVSRTIRARPSAGSRWRSR